MGGCLKKREFNKKERSKQARNARKIQREKVMDVKEVPAYAEEVRKGVSKEPFNTGENGMTKKGLLSGQTKNWEG